MQDLADRRMREDDLAELRGGVTHAYGERSCGDELRAGIADTMHAEDGVVLGIQNQFAQPGLAFVFRHKPSGVGHGEFVHLYISGLV